MSTAKDISSLIAGIGIVPVVVIDDAARAVPVALALQHGGVPVIEITFRTDAAAEAIKNIRAGAPGVVIGAGSVKSIEQAQRALDAGASFIVAGGLDPELVKFCISKRVPIYPGVCTPTEIQTGFSLGLSVLKFFPFSDLGGLKTLKAMSAPFPGITYIPTSGITADNVGECIASPLTFACAGSWLAPRDIIAQGNYDEITKRTRDAVMRLLGFEFAHVGINAHDAAEGNSIAQSFSTLFNLPLKTGSSSTFAGAGIEIIPGGTLGDKGHLAIRTNSIPCALYHLSAQGIAVDMKSAKEKGGRMIAVYLAQEIGGFAVHLLQR